MLAKPLIETSSLAVLYRDFFVGLFFARLEFFSCSPDASLGLMKAAKHPFYPRAAKGS